jgi:threonine dehydrogenase-like Zn-dependent dehydrogenase
MCAMGQTVLCENAGEGGTVGVGGGWGDAYTAHESQVWKVPEALSDDQATLVEPMAIAVHAVLRRRPQPGERVLVVGAGIIGLLVLQALRAIEPQARVAVVARHSHQEAAARRLGAEEVVRGPQAYAQLALWTGARRFRAPMNRGMLLGGVDVVYDCVGSAGSLTDALRWIRARGTLVLVGIDLRFLRVDLNPIWHQELSMIGASGYGRESWNGQTRHTFDLVMEMLEEGVLRADGLITHRFPLADYRKAIATAADKTSGSIKVVFELTR